jgi:glutathione peroxidase
MSLTFFDHVLPGINGTDLDLAALRGQVVLIVNVASQCGYTPQYEGLEALWQQYRDRGFTVIGCPCNQFGHQEPDAEAAIVSFCSTTYNVSFPLSAKLDVNGASAHPLWAWLQRERPGVFGTTAVKWNFTKFLIGRDGAVIDRFAPATTPASIAPRIEEALG